MAELEECRLEWSWISIRTSGGRGRDSESVQAIWKNVQAVKAKLLQTTASLHTFFVLVISAEALKSLVALLAYHSCPTRPPANAVPSASDSSDGYRAARAPYRSAPSAPAGNDSTSAEEFSSGAPRRRCCRTPRCKQRRGAERGHRMRSSN
jgi:hypothetical protein